jgi:hypothetical protein
MCLQTGGNVGIGTISPGSKLHVNGDFKAKTNIYLEDNNSASNIKIGYITNDGAGDFHIYDWTTPRVIMGYFKTNNYVTFPNGNVGIGTITPSYKLDVNGSTRVSGHVIATDGTNFTQLWSDGAVMVKTGGYLRFGTVDAIGAATNWSEKMRIHTDGSVGIGTSAPSKGKLEVAGVISSFQNGEARYHLFNNGGVAEWKFGQKTNSSHNFILSKVVSGADSDYMTVDTSGNVGIGTTSPSYKFHVGGKIYSDAQHLGNQGDSASVPSFTWPGNSNTGIYLSSAGAIPSIGFSTAGAERMRIDSSGNVGIGTSPGAYKLDVNGDVRVSGNWTWTATKNFSLAASANGQEWSFDLQNQNTYTGCHWQVWSDKNSRTVLSATGDTERVGVLTASPSYTFHVVGDIYASGNVTAYSDLRAKSNLEVIPNPLDKVQQLTGYTYEMIEEPELSTKITNRFTGIIAQDLEKVLPEAVHKDENGKYSVAYGNLAGLFVESIKDLTKEN